MAKKVMLWKTKGMNKDLSVSAFNPEFAFENMNLRLSTNDGNTLMSWVNEKGPSLITSNNSTPIVLEGIPIGTAVIDHKLVVFTTKNTSEGAVPNGTEVDYIYVLEYTNDTKTQMSCTQKYIGNLNFSALYPLETLVSYEADTIQKVYWVDGRNQPRVINICMNNVSWSNIAVDYRFDFVPRLQLNETITVKKLLGANGIFAPGVIQYAFTYYRKYGQESNIFYTTPLYYISYADRGASPEDKVANAFKITVTDVDDNFDYLRIYSIQRTSINGTPICKRIQDISINGLNEVSYTDTGMSGDAIDPTELLYKGGESVIVKTLSQKDDTLFMGNLQLQREKVPSKSAAGGIRLEGNGITRSFVANSVSSGSYAYSNQLTSTITNDTKSVPCGGFKVGDYYRCGVQFQDWTGKWSNPMYVGEVEIESSGNYPRANGSTITVPIIRGQITRNYAEDFSRAGYCKIRPVVVFPNVQGRVTICQGVASPTLFTSNNRGTTNARGPLYAQSSWFFRTKDDSSTDSDGAVHPFGYNSNATDPYLLPYSATSTNPSIIKEVEVQGLYDAENKFKTDYNFVTFHSPDIEFDDSLFVVDYNTFKIGQQVGKASFSSTLSDIDIQTETAQISNSGSGFIHKAFSKTSSHGIVSGLFYDDFVIDDDDKELQSFEDEKSPVKWMVYLWNKTGSLNNDINRPSTKGVGTAILKKKIISNLRYASTTYGSYTQIGSQGNCGDIKLFSSDQNIIAKVNGNIYRGNVDTVLNPDKMDSMYFAFDDNSSDIETYGVSVPFTANVFWKTYAKNVTEGKGGGIWKWQTGNPGYWSEITKYTNIFGNDFIGLTMKKDLVRMKYKSTPHLVIDLYNQFDWSDSTIPVIDIRRTVSNPKDLFGGDSIDALKENNWVPCGEPVNLSEFIDSDNKYFYYSYGDTYYQRYDCLKTYPFTTEDENQVVEIGSFMLETRVNIDGRYDRNRGQSSNLYMSPRNFNLLNPVYSQVDNFFTYKIYDDSYYENNTYPNQVTWSKTKTSGADVDLWTNVTLASTLELDGDKGEITSLQRFNDQLIAFQDSGISQILYNENVQIQSTDGVPIEIANSGKVQGKRYLSNTVGCSNKWSIENTPNGIYFMDSNEKSIYLFNGQLSNLSVSGGFNSWAKKSIPSSIKKWTPIPENNEAASGFDNFVSYYDKMNQDVLFINSEKALAWNEKFNVFTSFYSYGNRPYFNNLDDTGIWLNAYLVTVGAGKQWKCTLYKHQSGDYGNFFSEQKPYYTILVGNPDPQMDKIFTNLEFRACVEGEQFTETSDPFIPFDYLETWNEYQHGVAQLGIKHGHQIFKHHSKDLDAPASLNRKFRIWRCDIPRDNVEVNSSEENKMGIFRFLRRPMDRMRNPWIYLKLQKNAEYGVSKQKRAEIHDMMMTYYL